MLELSYIIAEKSAVIATSSSYESAPEYGFHVSVGLTGILVEPSGGEESVGPACVAAGWVSKEREGVQLLVPPPFSACTLQKYFVLFANDSTRREVVVIEESFTSVEAKRESVESSRR